jgi:hypothetical protein
MFFTYDQNNPNGRFNVTDTYGHCLCIEADTPEEANAKAESIVGSLEHRWSHKWREDQGTPTPTYYDEWSLLKMEDYFTGSDSFAPLYDIFVVDVYYKNGTRERKEYEAEKLYKKGRKARQDKADKLWGTCVNLSGLYSEKPIRVFKEESLDSFYDRAGDFSVPGPGLRAERDGGVIYFASENKEDVEEFIAGVKLMQHTLTDLAEKELNRVKGTLKRSGAKSVVEMFKRWAK